MKPFEDRPNLYEDQFSGFIRKDSAGGGRVSTRACVRACVHVCLCVWEGSGLQNITPVTPQLRL